MKTRFFYGPLVNHQNGSETWDKLFILTEDGRFYCEYLDWGNPAVVDENFDFNTFDPSTYKWGGYQEIVEINLEKAKSTQLTRQSNWIEGYLIKMIKKNKKVPNHLQAMSDYLEVEWPKIIMVLKEKIILHNAGGVGIKEHVQVPEYGIFECLKDQMGMGHMGGYFEESIEFDDCTGGIGTKKAEQTIFGRVVQQPETAVNGMPQPEMLFISNLTFQNVRVYLLTRNRNND